uniref:Uncharacterized protein n=1 Tax=Romanomermis culicivorax TaxID=13658 RepID=A0A915I2D9_ROMCU
MMSRDMCEIAKIYDAFREIQLNKQKEKKHCRILVCNSRIIGYAAYYAVVKLSSQTMVGKLAFSIASLVGEKTEAQKISSPDNNAEDNVTVKRKNGGETSDESGTVDQTVGDSPLASTANVMIEQQNETWKRLQQAFSLGVKDSTTMPFNGFPGLFAGQQQQSGPNILDPFRTTPNQWIEFVQKNLAVTSLYARLSQQQQDHASYHD